MSNIQAIQLLEILDKEELRKLGEYIRSPFFNKSKYVVQLFQILKKNYPNFTMTTAYKEKIAQKLFPKKTVLVRAVALRKAFSHLSRLIKDFLAYQAKNDWMATEDTLLLAVYAQRNAQKLLETHLQKLAKEEKTVQNTVYYFKEFIAENAKYELGARSTQQFLNTDLVKVVHKFDVFYLINKLKYCCSLLAKGHFLAIQQDVLLLPEIIQTIEQHKVLQQIPLLNIYYTTLQLLQQKEERFIVLKKLLANQYSILSKPELNTIYKLACNYCIKQLKAGITTYNQHLFDLYQTMLSQEALILKQYLLPVDFKNIATIAAKVQQFNWTTNFIETYKEKLPPEHQENMTHYTKGILAFYQKNHAKVLAHLTQVEHINFVYHLNTESLLIKTYYEVKQWQALESKLGAFRKYVERNTMMSESNKQAYYDFVKLSKRLFHWREKLDFAKQDTKTAMTTKTGLEKLLEAIEQCQPLIDKKWLLEKTKHVQQKLMEMKVV